MQLNVEVHNYMETLVGQVLLQEHFTNTYSNDQLADLACLALIQLRPIYIRYDVDFLSALAEERLVALKESAKTAVEVAESMIVNDRRRNREADVPTILSQSQFEQNSELEWFEKPFLDNK